jgi:hypothetical protein
MVVSLKFDIVLTSNYILFVVTDSSVLKNDMKQRLAKERRQERKRQEEGIFCLCFVHFF